MIARRNYRLLAHARCNETAVYRVALSGVLLYKIKVDLEEVGCWDMDWIDLA
jgi:hypothetical protein